MMSEHSDIRLSLPSKGRLAHGTADFLAACGLGTQQEGRFVDFCPVVV